MPYGDENRAIARPITDVAPRSVQLQVFSPITSLVAGSGAMYFFIPPELNNRVLSNPSFTVVTTGSVGQTQIQLNRLRSGTRNAMLSTMISMQNQGVTGSGAVVGANNQVLTNDLISVDILTVQTNAPVGLIVNFILS